MISIAGLESHGRPGTKAKYSRVPYCVGGFDPFVGTSHCSQVFPEHHADRTAARLWWTFAAPTAPRNSAQNLSSPDSATITICFSSD